MGLHDRDYARNDNDDRPLAAAVAGWSATIWLIAANVAVFVLWLAASDNNHEFQAWMRDHFTVSNKGVLGHLYFHTLITSFFSHMDAWHLICNMYFLYLCGPMIEDDIYGVRDFLLLFFVAGLAGGFADIGMTAIGFSEDIPALGASGAVMGVVVCCACFFPSRPILMFMFIPMQLRFVAMIYVALDLAALLFREADGVGHAAHLGGALAGYLFYKFDLRFFRDRATTSRRARGKGLFAWLGSLFRRRPRFTVIEGGKGRPPLDDAMPDRATRIDAETGKRVDALLAKISREGQGALTDEERAFLEEASRKYKK